MEGHSDAHSQLRPAMGLCHSAARPDRRISFGQCCGDLWTVRRGQSLPARISAGNDESRVDDESPALRGLEGDAAASIWLCVEPEGVRRAFEDAAWRRRHCNPWRLCAAEIYGAGSVFLEQRV